jgi:hypothetical protein
VLPGRAVQVGPMKPVLSASGPKRFKLQYGKLLSNVALIFNMRRYRVPPLLMTSAAATVRSAPLVVLIYIGGALSSEAGRGAFAARGAPRTLLLCAAAWLGPPDVARHVMRCHATPEMRNRKRVLVTRQAISARPYGVAGLPARRAPPPRRTPPLHVGRGVHSSASQLNFSRIRQ